MNIQLASLNGMVNLSTLERGVRDSGSMIKPNIRDQLMGGPSPAVQPGRALTPAEEHMLAQGSFLLNRDLSAVKDRSPNPYADLDIRNSGHVNLNLPSAPGSIQGLTVSPSQAAPQREASRER